MEKKVRAKKERNPSTGSIFDEEDISPPKKRKVDSVSLDNFKGNDLISNFESRADLALSDSSSSDESDDTSKPFLVKKSEISAPCNKLLDDESSDDSESHNEQNKTEYYDFSAIINSQAEITKYQSKSLHFEEPVEKEKSVKTSKSKTAKGGANSKRNRTKHPNTSKKLSSEELNVSELLAIGENCDEYTPISQSSNSLGPDQENVEKTVEVKIQLPTFSASRKNKRYDIEAALKRRLYSARKENQVFYHKVHLLCLIGHGNFVNSILNNESLLGCALSVIPSENFYPPKQASIEYLEKLVAWFSKKIKTDDKEDKECDLLKKLLLHFQERCSSSLKNKVLMFICIARVLGLKCRFMMSLQPMPLKPPPDPLLSTKENKGGKKKKEESDKEVSSDEDLTEVVENSERTSEGCSYFKKTPKSIKENRITKNTKSDSKSKPKDVKKKSKTVQAASKGKVDRRVLSTDSEEGDNSKKKKKGNDYWAEVFLESEEKWISVDVHRGKVHCVDQIYASCTHPVVYVLGWNNDYSFKDLTRRYCPTWMTTTRKLRVENSWWDEAIKPFSPKKTALEREEDYELDRILEEKPLPASITEFKNHPLYALKRHLLKFEAIYPPDARPVGFVKNEPVYSRLCVVQLHSKETWIREAKLVRLNEKPYKIVKARPKYDKLTGNTIKDLPLELFGYWQVEDYIPPVAVDGKVPRNDYGNVELYKPSMLPGGTVHLQIPGLMRVARKLGIDCAPAVVGWEFSGCSSHPVFDGFVVCEEFKDKILDCWNKDIDESAKKEKQKNEQRIYGNWRRLIKGLIIRERLEKRYNFGSSVLKEDKKKPVKKRN